MSGSRGTQFVACSGRGRESVEQSLRVKRLSLARSHSGRVLGGLTNGRAHSYRGAHPSRGMPSTPKWAHNWEAVEQPDAADGASRRPRGVRRRGRGRLVFTIPESAFTSGFVQSLFTMLRNTQSSGIRQGGTSFW
jgi:hypothetical protein